MNVNNIVFYLCSLLISAVGDTATSHFSKEYVNYVSNSAIIVVVVAVVAYIFSAFSGS